MSSKRRKYRDGQGICLTCSGPCDIRASRCRDCTRNAEYLICPGCRELVHRSAMTIPSGRKTSYCEPCRRAWHRNNRFKKRYGIDADEFDRLLARQDGRCAICGSTNSTRSGYPTLVVDHDHQTGEVRGLLCSSCNSGLGWFKDNPNFLAAAVVYLELNERVQPWLPVDPAHIRPGKWPAKKVA